MPPTHLLTKSKYIRGLQCEKALYLDVYQPRLARYSAETLKKFRGGRNFEHAFKSTFPDGIDICARLRAQVDKYPALTAQLLQQEGEVVLFEAGFRYNEVLVLADVVHKSADGAITIYEVKNGKAVSDTFRQDVAVQHYVISHALRLLTTENLFAPPLQLTHFYVLYNDGADGFAKEDLLEFAQGQVDDIAAHVERFKMVLQGSEPDIVPSPHCCQPYECPYSWYCNKAAQPTPRKELYR